MGEVFTSFLSYVHYMPEQGKNQLRKRKILLFLLSYRGKMRKKKIPLLYHCTIFMLYYVCDLLTMPEDDELSFAKACQRYVPNVVMTVVDVIGEEEVAACQKVCDTHGLHLRVRPYEAN